jgi:Flp pilus assembly protein TadG
MPKSRTNGRERGQALVLFVLGLAVLLGFVALTVDVGLILRERRQLQNAADAAALAGGLELPESQILAQSKAQEWAANNDIDLNEGDEIEITVSPDQTSVTVEITREASFIFGRVLGLSTVDVSASATAQVGAPAALSGVLPFGVLKSAINYDGTPTTIKYSADNPSTGNFGPIRIDGPGSSIHEQSIKYGTENQVCADSQPSCADPTVITQTGNLIGATRDGFRYRLDNTSTNCDQFDEVLAADGNGGYNVKASCNPFGGSSNSLRLVLIPVIDSFPSGSSQPMTIQYFTALFLNDLENCTGITCDVTGTFVKTVVDPTNDAVLGIYDEESGVKFVRLVE